MSVTGSVRGVLGWVLPPGSIVHERYRVAAVLGKGGFGVTYLVEDIRLAGKRRALKEIPRPLFDEHETRLLGRLNHPAIPDIIDWLDLSGMVYLVLELGGNRTLRMELERQGGRIPVFLLINWIDQVCDALIYLHSQVPPVVHRDLKPDNILLDDAERVMLIDFGIAKEGDAQNETHTLGRAVSHGFSPPEQFSGGTDPRSDVYALGAVMYWALTARVPPAADERMAGAVLEQPSRLFPDIPPLLEQAICRALELDARKRQQSVAELAECLAPVGSGAASAHKVFLADTDAPTEGLANAQWARPHGVEPPSPRLSQRPAAISPGPRARKSAWGWVAGGLASLVLIASGAWLYGQWPEWRSAAEPTAPDGGRHNAVPGQLIGVVPPLDSAWTGAQTRPVSATLPESASPGLASVGDPAATAPLLPLDRSRGADSTARRLPPPEPIEAQTGHLQVNVSTEARVMLDGRFVGAAAPGQPLNLSDVAVGEHLATVFAKGYATEQETVRVELGRWTQEAVTLVPESAPIPAPKPQPTSPDARDFGGAPRVQQGPSPSFRCGGRLRPVESVICGDAELARADGLLGKVYKDLRARLAGGEAEALRSAQRAWIERRDRRCPTTAADLSSGSDRAPSADCLHQATLERVAELQVLLRSVSRR